MTHAHPGQHLCTSTVKGAIIATYRASARELDWLGVYRTLPLKRPPVLIATINPDWRVGGYLNMLQLNRGSAHLSQLAPCCPVAV